LHQLPANPDATNVPVLGNQPQCLPIPHGIANAFRANITKVEVGTGVGTKPICLCSTTKAPVYRYPDFNTRYLDMWRLSISIACDYSCIAIASAYCKYECSKSSLGFCFLTVFGRHHDVVSSMLWSRTAQGPSGRNGAQTEDDWSGFPISPKMRPITGRPDGFAQVPCIGGLGPTHNLLALDSPRPSRYLQAQLISFRLTDEENQLKFRTQGRTVDRPAAQRGATMQMPA